MVAAVRAGASQRAVARQFGVSLCVVQHWMGRAADRRLDRVDWDNHCAGSHSAINRCAQQVEDQVLSLRQELQGQSALGEFGAAALHRVGVERDLMPDDPLPCARTMHRILERHGVLDRHSRQRRPAPPRGWYLSAVAAGQAELDQFDAVSGLVIQGGPEVEVFTAISLHGGWIGAWPGTGVTAASTRAALLEHWRAWGLPRYAQFDNDTRFQGPHQHPDVVGSVSRLCLSLGVTPVFAPPRETGFQAAIESLNGRWQAKVWARFHHDSLLELQARSQQYVRASHQRASQRQESAPPREPFPATWKLNLQAPPQGQIIYLRRTSDKSVVQLLGHTFEVDKQWPHRLVRAEIDLNAGCIRFFRLRRREPTQQPLLKERPYELPKRQFRE